MVIFYRGSNSMLSGYFSDSLGLFMCDSFNKKEAIRLFRKHYGLKGKHISFYFNDGKTFTLYK